MSFGKRPSGTASSTRTGLVSASDAIAPASPLSLSARGCKPRASSRSSASVRAS